MNWNEFVEFCNKHELSAEEILEMVYSYLSTVDEMPELYDEIDQILLMVRKETSWNHSHSE